MSRRSNGQGHTYKVKNSYRTVIHHNGHIVTAMAATTQESRRLAKEKLEKLPKATGVTHTSAQSKLALTEFLISWLDETHKHQIAHSTWRRYRALAIHHINPVIGPIPLKKITPLHISKVIAAMRDAQQSPRSQQQARALLSVALRQAEDNGYISSNPVSKVRIPLNRSKEIEPLTVEEVRRLLSTFEGTYLAARLHIALLAGLRQGEALGLCWQDIDFEIGTLRVRQQLQKVEGALVLTALKTHRSKRTIALTQESLRALLVHQRLVTEMRVKSADSWQENDLVFPSSDGCPRAAIVDYNEWKRALRLCGVAKRRLHDARHTAATLMYSQGVGIEVISRALGHSSSAITSKLYVHSSLQPQMAAADLIEKLMKS